MKEYLITVTSEISKHYLIDALSNLEAMCIGFDCFVKELEINEEELNNIRVNIESIGEIDEVELSEENKF